MKKLGLFHKLSGVQLFHKYDKLEIRTKRKERAGMANIKQDIEAVMLDLGKDKPFDKITVKDLVTACGISRQTFYYHFQNILEVVEWSFKNRLDNLINQSRQISKTCMRWSPSL